MDYDLLPRIAKQEKKEWSEGVEDGKRKFEREETVFLRGQNDCSIESLIQFPFVLKIDSRMRAKK